MLLFFSTILSINVISLKDKLEITNHNICDGDDGPTNYDDVNDDDGIFGYKVPVVKLMIVMMMVALMELDILLATVVVVRDVSFIEYGVLFVDTFIIVPLIILYKCISITAVLIL